MSEQLNEVLRAAAPAAVVAALATPPSGAKTIAASDYERRKFIGSSNVAAIMGLSPEINGERYTDYDVYLAKTGDQPEEMDPQTKLFLERRKRWEPVIIQMLKEEFSSEIVGVNRQYVDPHIPYLAAEIDWEWMDNDGVIYGGETKTVSPRAFSGRFGWGEPGTGDVPIHYECQVQFGLGITGYKRTVLAAMVGLDSVEFYIIERDEEAIAQLRAACVKFWTKNVLARVAPEPQTLIDLKKLYPNTVIGKQVSATDDLGSKALRLRAVHSQMDALKMEEAALEFEVKLGMKDAEALLVDGQRLVTWKEQNWSLLDQTSLKEKNPKVYKEFMISGRRRTFKTLAGWPNP